MRKITLALVLFIGFSQWTFSQEKLQGSYTLKVDLSSLPDKPGKLFTSYYNYQTRESIVDSVEVNGDEVKFKGNLEEPLLMSVRYVSKAPPSERKIRSGNFFSFYLSPGDIKITAKDSLSNSIVKGSATQLAYEKLNEMNKPFNEQSEALSKTYNDYYIKKDTVNMTRVEKEFDNLDAEIREKVNKPFIEEYALKSPVAIRVIRQTGGETENEFVEQEKLLAKLAPQYRNLPSAKGIEESIAIGRKTAIGAMAMDFSQNDTLDNPIKLSSFKGRYVLLDFWASWCGPCRRENPNLVKSFSRFKEKGFTVFSVSLDQPGKKEKWLKAIHDDNLAWTHVSDLKYWANAIAMKYGINSIPANFLIDPQGKIVAKNLRGAELDKKLEEVFSSSKTSISSN